MSTANLLETFRDTAIKAHIGFKHDGPWEECEWVECEDRKKMIESVTAPIVAPEVDMEVLAKRFDYAALKGFNQSESEFENGYKHAMEVAARVVREAAPAAAVVSPKQPESDTCICGHSRWDHWGWGNFACSHGDCSKFTTAPASPAALRDEAVCKCGLDKDDPIHSFSTERQQMHSFTPRDVATPLSTLAKAAAEEIQDWNECGETQGSHDADVAFIQAIIERCLVGGE